MTAVGGAASLVIPCRSQQVRTRTASKQASLARASNLSRPVRGVHSRRSSIIMASSVERVEKPDAEWKKEVSENVSAGGGVILPPWPVVAGALYPPPYAKDLFVQSS